MDTRLKKDVRFLKIYALVATLVCGILLLTAFQTNKKAKFSEIDVERINVLQKNGKYKLVLTNDERSPDVIVGDRVLVSKREQGGIYFYNDLGEESGGLYSYGTTENGKVSAGTGLNFDQYRQDQTVGLLYSDNNGRRRAGLFVQDRSNIPQPEWNDKYDAARKLPPGPARDEVMGPLLNPYRVYVGKTDGNDSAVLLYDRQGKTRIRLIVADDTPKLEFLDTKGNVVQTYPAGPLTAKPDISKQ